MIKIVTSKKTPTLPSYWFLPASLCTQTSASQVLCDVDYRTNSCCWKYPSLNIAGGAVSSPLDYAGCHSTVCPAKETAWSCPAAQAQQGMITVSLFSLLAQRRNICSLCFPGINLLLLSLSREGSQTQNSRNYLALPDMSLCSCPAPKIMHLIEDF